MIKILTAFIFGLIVTFSPITMCFANEELNEIRAQDLEKKLMAPCCWGGVIADHSSDAALEMKAEIRTALTAGQTETQILKTFSDKFGERVLAQPTSVGFNRMVWFMPGIAMIFGTAFLLFALRRFRAGKKNTPNETLPPEPTATVITEADKKYYAQISKEVSQLVD